MAGRGANHVVEDQLQGHLKQIGEHFGADCLTYIGPIGFRADDYIRDAVEAFGRHKRRLVFILETDGGFAESARRIADTVRKHYREVDFLIPNYAMSAGTILAMSGNRIWMDYYSVLGPIDPQVPSRDDRRLVPALGYLIRYEELLKKANAGQAGAAELQILLDFDQGSLYAYDQARELSVALLEEWLAKHKFKNWKKTATKKKAVTTAMKKARAREIASKLNNPKRWNSHGLGINKQVLERELKLKIEDFGRDRQLSNGVREYHRLLVDYMSKRGHQGVVHTCQNCELLRF